MKDRIPIHAKVVGHGSSIQFYPADEKHPNTAGQIHKLTIDLFDDVRTMHTDLVPCICEDEALPHGKLFLLIGDAESWAIVTIQLAMDVGQSANYEESDPIPCGYWGDEWDTIRDELHEVGLTEAHCAAFSQNRTPGSVRDDLHNEVVKYRELLEAGTTDNTVSTEQWYALRDDWLSARARFNAHVLVPNELYMWAVESLIDDTIGGREGHKRNQLMNQAAKRVGKTVSSLVFGSADDDEEKPTLH